MGSILIIQSFSRARLFFGRQPRELFEKGQYLAFSKRSSKIIKSLEDLGLKAVLPGPISKELRDEFLRDYLNIMDILAVQNGHDLQWWATDLASKNRFTSPLPGLLNTFACCLEAIEDMSGQERLLVLVKPPWPVVCALQDSARRFGWDFRVLAWPWSRPLTRWNGKARTWVGIFKDCLASVLRIRKSRLKFGRSLWQRIGEKPVYLIKSFAYLRSFAEDNHYQDPFLGEISEFLSKSLGDKIDILTVAVSFGKRDECLKRMRCAKGNPVVPLEVFLTWRDVLKGFQELLWGRLTRPFRISGGVSFLGHEIGTLLRDCLASGGWKIPFYQYLHLAAGVRIANTFKLYSCALTFEGNPWERMFISGIQQNNSQLPIYGYQHSVVPQAAAGVFISPREKENSPLPSSILTTGEITAGIIRRYGISSVDYVRTACALRYQYLYNIDYQEKSTDQDKLLVLVALEGVWEVLPLLEYLLDQAPKCSNALFRVRAHPVLPLSKLLNRLGRRIKPGGNIEASSGGAVESDLEDSSVVLYWGTTVALEALMMGKPLIHFDRGDFLSYDPLFEFNDFKWTVGKNQELHAVLEEIRDLTEDRRAVLKERGRNYIRSYFYEVDDKSMSKFLPEIN